MLSHNAQMAWVQAFGILAAMVVACVLAIVVWAITDRVRARRAAPVIEEALARVDRSAPCPEDASRQRLLAAIPAQRQGGESGAR